MEGRPVAKAILDEKTKSYLGFHTLRHSFASNLAARGVDQRIVDHFMGHQTKEMRMRYQHLFPERREKAILKLKFADGR
jgi:integrase